MLKVLSGSVILKRINKGAEPRALKKFRDKKHNTNNIWKFLSDYNRSLLYKTIKNKKIQNQLNICAYCESKLDTDLTKIRLEHSKDKEILHEGTDLTLVWSNILAVCFGNQNTSDKEPYNTHLHCDSYKSYIKSKQEIDFTRFINPHFLPAKTRLVTLDRSTGSLKADEENCLGMGRDGEILLDNINYTIEILNLNCQNLRNKRLALFGTYKKKKSEARVRNSRAPLDSLLELWFAEENLSFFSTKRILAGANADLRIAAKYPHFY